MTAVHQLVPVYTRGDAISGAVRKTRSFLREAGFDSEIYADVIDPAMKGEAKHLSSLPDLSHTDALLYHESLRSTVADVWAASAAKRVLVYHNITPSKYFRDVSARVTHDLDSGRAQLPGLVKAADLCIAVSGFNASELHAHGTKCVVIPPPVDLDRLQPKPSHPTPGMSMLFVGRLAPNKRQDFLIDVLYSLRNTSDPDARLTLAGGSADTGDYVRALRWRARRFGVENAVDIPENRLSDSTLRDLYMSATVFVCASEHEGFCVPLLEAMAFEVPVVALSAGAVADTVGDAAILLRNHDPLVWGEVVHEVSTNTALRHRLIAAGNHRLQAFSDPKLSAALLTALNSAGVRT